MRLTAIRGPLVYYARRELDDDLPAAREWLGAGWSRSAPRHRDSLELPRAPRTQIGALDLTIAAPKDVSVVWGLARPSSAERIAEAHRQAVRASLGWLERLDLSRLVEGVAQPAEGLFALGIHHVVSRAADPHLHTHLLLANALVVGGRLVPLDHARLRRAMPALELAYRVELAAQLRHVGLELSGFGFERWTLEGLPQRLAAAFSTRRAEVLALVGRDASPRARERAVLSSRRRWSFAPVALDEARRRWSERAARTLTGELGVDASPRGALPRARDPLFDELVVQAHDRPPGADLAAVVRATLEAAFGRARTRALLRGVEVRAEGEHFALDGTLARRYGSLSTAARLRLAGYQEAVRSVYVSSHDAVALSDDLRAQLGRSFVRVEATSEREAAIIRAVGGFVPGQRGATVVVDAARRGPSRLRRYVAEERSWLVEVVRTAPAPRRGSLCLTRDGVELEVFESLTEALERAAELACSVMARAQVTTPVVSVEDRALVHRLRRQIASARGVGCAPTWPGDRIELDGRGVGVVKCVNGDRVVVTVDGADEEWELRATRLTSVVVAEPAVISVGWHRGRAKEVSVVAAPELGRLRALGRRHGVDVTDEEDLTRCLWHERCSDDRVLASILARRIEERLELPRRAVVSPADALVLAR